MKIVVTLLAVALAACAASAEPAEGTEETPSSEEHAPLVDAELVRVRAPMQCDCVKDKDGNLVCSDCHPIGGTYTSGAGNIW